MKQKNIQAPIISLMAFCLMGLHSSALAQEAAAESDDNTVERQLDAIDVGSKRQRKEAMQTLRQELRQKPGRPTSGLSPNKRDKLTRTLMKAYRQEHDKDADADEIRLQVAELITSHGQSSEAKAFLDELMESGDERVRTRVMQWLGHPDGVSGDDLADKINKWADKGFIPKKARFSLMAKVSKRRAVPEIMKAVDSTNDREELLYAAWALQDVGSQKDMARAYKKVRDLGLHKKTGDAPNQLYWVDKKKFSDYARNSSGDDLKVVLELMGGSETMKPLELVPMLIAKLDDPDIEIRQLAVARLKEASGNYRMDYESAIRGVEARLPIEEDVALKKNLARCLRILKQDQVYAKAFLTKEQEWIKKNAK